MVVDLTISLVLCVIIITGLVWLEQRGLVELEWNPLSDPSRAARAERAGNLVEALALYERAGQPNRVVACLYRNLPASPLRAALVDAADEFLALKAALPVLDAHVIFPTAVNADRVVSYVDEVGALLWLTAERLALAFTVWESLDEVADLGPPEVEKLTGLTANVRQVRIGLARAILAEPEARALDEALADSPARTLGSRAIGRLA